MSLRVITWNVLGRLLGCAAADVVCLQEIDQTLFALVQEHLASAWGRPLTKSGRREGCAIFVRRDVGAVSALCRVARSRTFKVASVDQILFST